MKSKWLFVQLSVETFSAFVRNFECFRLFFAHSQYLSMRKKFSLDLSLSLSGEISNFFATCIRALGMTLLVIRHTMCQKSFSKVYCTDHKIGYISDTALKCQYTQHILHKL